ncbi:MAG: TM0106 family RecB-like putative nuclease [Lewinella sp.]|nr:TM0106 family RecB-like putative nuclease [Lewinella sp.]
MKNINGLLQLSASDLVGHLNCKHLSALDLQVAAGSLSKPDHYDPLLEILRERGFRHEQDFIAHLEESGFQITAIDGVDIYDEAVNATLQAMSDGQEIIVQGALRHGRWSGRADILKRVEVPSDLGGWSYELIDTKLARETKGGSVLQLCLYADLLSHMQGLAPENVYIISPWTDFEPQRFRFPEYAAYFRRVKQSAENAVDEEQDLATYPDPKSHCDICRWQNDCDKRRRDDDHLCLVANISKSQINEFHEQGIETRHALATLPSPLPFTPKKGSPLALEKARDQAAIQVRALELEELQYELLDVVAETGLAALPEPSPGDIFFDIESDQFVGEHGIEYLFGYAYADDSGELHYEAAWAFDREAEKAGFERFVDFVSARRELYPELHIYHFAPYEPAALKRLMGRYATRENEIDNLLRGKAFVDLLSVVRNALRASVESYSLKKLEPFFEFQRQVSLHEANVALTKLSAGLELNDIPSITDDTKDIVRRYNADDCFSTALLRDWLESLRGGLVSGGMAVPRPAPGQEGPSEELDEQSQRVQELIARLTHDVPVDINERSPEQQARWILAYLLEWHRREDKAVWWEYFRLSALIPDELVSEKSALAYLTLVGQVDATTTGIPTHRYRFAQQDTDVRIDDELRQVGGDKIGSVVALNAEERTVDIKKSRATAEIHPEAIFAHKIIPAKEQAASLFRLGEYVADHGIEGEGAYKSSRDLLLRLPPDVSGELFRNEGEDTLSAALRLSTVLTGGVLPVQGPPGTGKSYTGARMICSFVSQGRKVGITANSHKVIRNLIDKVNEASEEMGIALHCVQKPGIMEPDQGQLSFVKNNGDVISALSQGVAQVAGATHFFWSREEAFEAVDVLVVDEAAQMALANVLAVGHAAPQLILLGDPQQLEQPSQGSHPDGTGVSSLDHILGGHPTIPEDKGLFLEHTWRLHPDICNFTSELFYEGKLSSIAGCELQQIQSQGLFSGSGLRYVPVVHSGNTSSSLEEARAVKFIVDHILGQASEWTDRSGEVKPLTLEDILIITPYNAQVFEIQQLLPGAHVGTVDKFQGQEAPITIYSMATSSHGDAPRGMEFLYSSNRLNVAISRAKCLSILIGSPAVFEADCRTPRQMKLANAHCRYLELAQEVLLDG